MEKESEHGWCGVKPPNKLSTWENVQERAKVLQREYVSKTGEELADDIAWAKAICEEIDMLKMCWS